MLPYLGMVAFIAGMAFVNSKSAMWKFYCYAVVITVIVFTGLRYNIGYDWLAYERLFEYSPDNFSFEPYFSQRLNLQVEILFYALIVVLKGLGLEFSSLLFIIAFINIVVIHKAIMYMDRESYAFSWIVYFTIAIIAVQFNIIRQALASSFVIMAFIFVMQRRYMPCVVMALLGALVHVSIILFYPLLLLGDRRLNPLIAVAIGGAGIVVFVGGGGIIGDALGFAANYLPGAFSQKAVGYSDTLVSNGAGPAVSPFAVALTLIHIAFSVIFYKNLHRDRRLSVAFNLSIFMIALHLLFFDFPSMWNRGMAVALPLQLPAVWLCLRSNVSPSVISQGLVAAILMSLGANYYLLSRPGSLAFVPYHSLLQVWILNDEGNGRQRTEYAIRLADEQAAQR